MTTRLLADAGLQPGMRVLDVGCGRGDVAALAAQLVGPTGQVIGIDRDRDVLQLAHQRVRDAGVSNVTFAPLDLAEAAQSSFADSTDTELFTAGSFDAVIGRRVLMYVREPLPVLRALVQLLRPGGLMVFQEHDGTVVPASLVELPLHRRVHGWIWETVKREGADVHMGFHLPPLLEQAGLVVEHVRAEAVIQTREIAHGIEPIVRAMLPRMLQHGVATEAEIALESLAQRLDAERRQASATQLWDLVFGVWARKP
jgi:SAM-dependent methyltransferase